ncbi:MAG: hypothetical protein JNL12_09685 [Planctomycetes bacterium]|nr:hypothetical protein [Planctomycetota bacterium]
MGTHGDITDEFDDELSKSIEAASTKGSWKNEATFEDPKLREIAKQLATTPRETYAERRLRELQEKAAKKEQQLVQPTKTAFAEEAKFREVPEPDPVPDTLWREAVPQPVVKGPIVGPRNLQPAGPDGGLSTKKRATNAALIAAALAIMALAAIAWLAS